MADSLLAAMSGWLTPSFLFLFLNLTIGIIVVISTVATRRDKQHRRQQPIARSPSLLDRARSFKFSSLATGLAVSDSAFQPPASELNESPPHEFFRTPSLFDRARSFKFSFLAAELPQAETAFQAPADSVDSRISESEEVRDSESPNLVRDSSLLDRLSVFNLSFKKRDVHPNQELQPAVRIVGRVEAPNRDLVMITDPEPEPEPPRRFPAGKMARSASSNPPRMKEAAEEDDLDRRRPSTARDKGSAAMVDEEVDAKADDFINRFKQQLKLQRVDSLLRYREMRNRGSAR